MPIIVGWLTVPGFFDILLKAPSGPFWTAFLLGAAYGFGGMSFGKAINHIGYSLTYTLAIGISAVLGTIFPLMVFGGLGDFFLKPGGGIVVTGMILSLTGVVMCGWAGFKKEKDLNSLTGSKTGFNMKIGLFLTIVAGVLSGVFNLSLEFGQPIADMAAQNGAGNFQGNAKMIISTSGCFVVNFIWFIVAGIRQGTLKEFIPQKGLSGALIFRNWFWSALAGSLWCFQFFFYGLGHVKMGNFQYASWVLHMSMLIFFSYIVGMIMKEWKTVKRPTYFLLLFGLLILITSFFITSYGSYYGEKIINSRQVNAAQDASNINQYNVIWDSPSDGSFGSMPLGNGDVGLNVWVEKNGDLLFYISKVDAFDSGHRLPKLGRIRLTMEPAIDVSKFRQILSLADASVMIEAGDLTLRLWVDANQPVIRLEGNSETMRIATLTMESLRPLANADEQLPMEGTAGVIFNNNDNRLAWCYRNQSSEWANNFKSQNTPEMVAKTKDPILHRTSGCLLQGEGFIRENSVKLRLKEKSLRFDCSVKVLSSQPESLEGWLSEITKPVKYNWDDHCAYWNSFWNRSYIHVTSGGEGKFNFDQCRYTQFAQGSKAYEGYKEIDAMQNVRQISQRYALERFCEAAAGRGSVPPPYNGSIFTMDMPAGVLGFDQTKESPVSPDGRDWDILSFMWQNTRHPYWSMAARGDYDAILPGMQFVRNGLEICKDHCKKIFGHEGAFIMEASWWYNVGVFNWDQVPPHLRYHQLATIELPAIMCEYYEHTRDPKFLKEILLPCADEFLEFYEVRFPKRDSQGKILMEGVGCAETYQGVTNPCTEIGCLKYVLSKLISFDIDNTRKQHWTNLLKAMPDVPLRKIRGLDLLAVGEKYNPGRVNCESPELYSIYPFRQVWLGKPALLPVARQSIHLRTISIDGTNDDQGTETGGWQSSPVQAAYLGLPREAARLVSINFNDQFIRWNDNIDPGAPYPQRPRARFPAFWECKMDGTPDNDHGASSVNALQSMLLQSDGQKIFLLPAWPENWDVSFKLCAAGNTTVECVFRDGKVQSLQVVPKNRLADITDMSTPEQRIRTLVEVALADHNYLFGLPPMLDAQPLPGKVTSPWISRYGETISGCKAGPWANSLFKGNVVYVHILKWPTEGVHLPSIPFKLISSTSITGNIQVRQDEKGWLLTGTPDPLNTIVRLEFDQSVEAIAMNLPSVGSFTAGKIPVVKSGPEGLLTAEIDLGSHKLINRFEFSIDNPGYLRGQGRAYEFQVKQPNATWKTAFKGKVYGTICGKAIDPVTTNSVRLIVQASNLKQLDAF